MFIADVLLCRNIDNNSKFIAKNQDRAFTVQHLKRTLANGEVVDRNWVIYSPSKNSIFCFVCRLFGKANDAAPDIFASVGLSSFYNIPRDLKRHETSSYHCLNDLAYKARQKESNTIDACVINQSQIEMDYWRAILKRIVSVIKFLGARGLAFRGENQTCGSNQNGNFLGILDLLSEFDPLLATHITRYGNKGRGIVGLSNNISQLSIYRYEFIFSSGRASYLSGTICDEFITLIGSKVLNAILNEMKDAKYYSISVDSTPDVSHCDQLVFCVRYMKDGLPVERFIQFISINQHNAQYLTEIIMKFLTAQGINLSDCRGQSYDNANNMSGKYAGLQQLILELNPLALFVPCAAHSLNLVGTGAVAKNKRAIAFFCFMEALYSFFVYSTFRWDLLKSALGPNQYVLKRASGTRWSCKHDAVSALNGNIMQVKAVLLRMIDDENEEWKTTPENKALAIGHLKELCKFENIFMLKMWNNILAKFNVTNRTLQKSDLNLSVAAEMYRSTIAHMESLKDRFDEFFQDAKTIYVDVEIEDAEKYAPTTRSAITLDNMEERKEFCKSEIFLPVLDSLITNLNTRMACYVEMDEKFSFLTKLNQLQLNEIITACQRISSFYKNDVDAAELISECEIAREYFFTNPAESVSPASLYFKIISDGLQSSFPNIEIVLRMFLSMFATNVPGERSFSKLKLIKDVLRNSMGEKKLNAFSLMSIETEILESLNYDDIIDEFILSKRRKMNISLST